MQSQTSMLYALARIFRFEYLYATFPGLSITFFLCARSPVEFFQRSVIEGLAIIALMSFRAWE